MSAASFVPFSTPPRLALTGDDEAAIATLEAGWGAERAPFAGAAAERAARRPRRRQRAQDQPRGRTVREAARALDIPLAAFIAFCDHHAVLELRPCEGRQRRRFVSDAAQAAGLGWNIIPPTGGHARRKGHKRGVPFAVFDPKRLDDLVWLFDWAGIVAAVGALPSRMARREFLMQCHGYLPDGVVALLSGYARSAVQKARRARLDGTTRRAWRDGRCCPQTA